MGNCCPCISYNKPCRSRKNYPFNPVFKMSYFDILRIVVYFGIVIASSFGFYLYYYGYYILKKTPIIKTLSCLFFSIAIFFLWAIVLAFSTLFKSEYYLFIRNMAGFVALPMFYYLLKF